MACSGDSRFSEVPVVNVTADNIKELWPSLVLALKTSTFVALDTVMSVCVCVLTVILLSCIERLRAGPTYLELDLDVLICSDGGSGLCCGLGATSSSTKLIQI